MSMLCIFDGDALTDLAKDILGRLGRLARDNRQEFLAVELQRNDIPACLGCLRCVSMYPGTCVLANETFGAITEKAVQSSVIVFLTPVVFGTYSSVMKNIIDRGWLIIKNHQTCRHVVIGYGEGATGEERSTFLDITAKHRGKAEIVHPNVKESWDVFFTGGEGESQSICAQLEALGWGA